MSTEKNSFLQRLEQQFSSLTPTGKRIASYLLGNPEQLPFESADSIAQQASTTGISVGRFLRSLGYRNLDEVKKSLRGEAPSSWLITDRIAAFRAETNQDDALDRSMSREIEVIQHAYGLARSEVTRVIQELEQELGFALFERSGPKVTPTHKAFMMYAEVESALLGIRNIRQRAQHIAQEENHQIKLVAISALALGLLPDALSNLPERLRPQQIQL